MSGMDVTLKRLSMDLHRKLEDPPPDPTTDPQPSVLSKYPFWLKSVVLFLVINPIFSIYFCYDSLGAVSPYLIDNDILTTEQLAWLYTVYAILPPVVVMGSGILVDKFGTRPVAIMSLIPTILGNAFVMIGIDYHFYWLVLIGRVLMGVSESVYVVVLSVLSIMFDGKWLVIGSAIAIAWGNLGASTVFLILPSILPYGLSSALSMSVVSPSFSLITTVIFFLLDFYYFGNRTQNKMSNHNTMNISFIKKLPRAFWIVVVANSLSLACVVVGFSFGPLYLCETMGYTTAQAGYIISFTNLMALFAPLTGWALERYGYKCEAWQVGSLFVTLSLAMIGMGGYQVGPLWFVLIGLCVSLLGGPLLAAIPIVVKDESIMGTAFGISALLIELGFLIFPEIIGLIRSHGGGWYGYLVLAGISFLCLLCLFYLKVLDKRHKIFLKNNVEEPERFPNSGDHKEEESKNDIVVEEGDHEKSSLVELSEGSTSGSHEEVMTNLEMVAKEKENFTSDEDSSSDSSNP